MEQQQQLIPHLFRTEYTKIVSVLCKVFGFEHIEIAEDIASDTFLLAAETWGLKGLPANPIAWLYSVAKNKALNYLNRNKLFENKISPALQDQSGYKEEAIDLSVQNIVDSSLQMMFAICHPAIPVEAQIGLSLRILCGLGIDEIAEAFLSNKQTISKRLQRAKEKLREEKIKIEMPSPGQINVRLETVLSTLYLLFNEGYHSTNQKTVIRKDLCLEAIRLAVQLTANPLTNTPPVNALLSLMCFHASRLEARLDAHGDIILYSDQDPSLWNAELISKGEYFLNASASGNQLSRYHIEAAIAYWHTHKDDSTEKWENILHLYNRLLVLEYSPVAALNRTYALFKVKGAVVAVTEALKLNLQKNHFYFTLLGELYKDIDQSQALQHYNHAYALAKTNSDKQTIHKKIVLLGST